MKIITALCTALILLGVAQPAGAQIPNYEDANLQEAWDWVCYHPEVGWEPHGFEEVLVVLDARATCHNEFWMLNGVHLWDETRHPGGPNAGDTLNEWMIGGSIASRNARCHDYGGTPVVFLGIVICATMDF